MWTWPRSRGGSARGREAAGSGGQARQEVNGNLEEERTSRSLLSPPLPMAKRGPMFSEIAVTFANSRSEHVSRAGASIAERLWVQSRQNIVSPAGGPLRHRDGPGAPLGMRAQARARGSCSALRERPGGKALLAPENSSAVSGLSGDDSSGESCGQRACSFPRGRPG